MLLIQDAKRVRVIVHDLLEDPEARKLIEEILVRVAIAYTKGSG